MAGETEPQVVDRPSGSSNPMESTETDSARGIFGGLRKRLSRYFPFLMENDGGIEEDCRLVSYRVDYDRWAKQDKKKCPWKKIKRMLLSHENFYLGRAEAMVKGGVLFGIDAECNPLIADSGHEPIMTNMNYSDTRRAVYFADAECQQPTGYEMFPYAGNCSRSLEIYAFEKFTGRPFVVSLSRYGWQSAWLENGEKPIYNPRVAGFSPEFGSGRGSSTSYVGTCNPKDKCPERGTRRLLRLKELET